MLSVIQRALDPRIFVPLAAVIYLAVSLCILRETVLTPIGRADLVSGDAGHYVSIADTFAKGDFSMNYVKDKPHRQPLYPACIAPVMRAKGHDLFWMGAVNVGFAALGFIVLSVALWQLYASRWITAIVGMLYLLNPFLLAQTTRHFMTEPLHILLMIAIIYAFLAYLRKGRFRFIAIAAAATGLDYLARPNGLFIFASLVAVLILADAWQIHKQTGGAGVSLALRKGLIYVGIVAIFMFITIPSWLPRLRDFGSPFYHGYLSNYMWVDTYKEGHVGQKEAIYTWHDYVKTHTAWDAVKRMAWGVWKVGFFIPWNIERYFPLLILLATLGVVVTLRRGPPEYRLLALFALLQILPLMWTTISNPNVRVPYASTFPFELAFAAACLRFGGSFLSELLLRVPRVRGQ